MADKNRPFINPHKTCESELCHISDTYVLFLKYKCNLKFLITLDLTIML